jgi:hypothetical protein
MNDIKSLEFRDTCSDIRFGSVVRVPFMALVRMVKGGHSHHSIEGESGGATKKDDGTSIDHIEVSDHLG